MVGSGLTYADEQVEKLYRTNRKHEKENKSLSSLNGVQDFLKNALLLPFKDFPKSLWCLDYPRNASGRGVDMINIIKFSLTHFHSQCLNPSQPTGHERTFFVTSVVPVFENLSRVARLVDYHW
jgi:hypothetical protein